MNKPKISKNITKATIQWQWFFFSKYKKEIALSLFRVVEIALLVIIVPLIISRIVSLISEGNTDQIPRLLLIISALSALGIMSNLISFKGLSKAQAWGQSDIYAYTFNHLTKQSYSFFSNSFGGSLVNYVNKFAGSFIQFWDAIMIDGVQFVTSVVFSFIVLAFYDLTYALIMLFFMIAASFIVVKLTQKRIPYRLDQVRQSSKLTGELADNITNVLALKSFSSEKKETSRFKKTSDSLARKRIISWDIAIKNGATIIALGIGLQLFALLYGYWLISNGQIDLGAFLVAQFYAVSLVSELWSLNSITRTMEGAFTDAQEMIEILAIEPSVKDPTYAKRLQASRGDIRLQNVTFTHQESTKPLFKDLDLHIKPGEKVGVVGLSGGGKTTLTKLLLRFHDIDSGEILIDGQDIRTVKQSALRESITYVPQEPLLFHRSIGENIAYANPKAGEDEIEGVSKLAYAHEFVKDLPNKYETLVGERGVKLSGGQKQRVAIARAILKNSPILIFDEATSALDSESEAAIQKAMKNIMKGKTTMVIAHRLSTIQSMDRIIVLEDGRIKEQGSHKELLYKNGIYAKLWGHQSGGFLTDDDSNK